MTGFRSGYAGLVEGGPEPIRLTPDVVHGINRQGGTMLGTSRGAQDPDAMVDRLIALGIDLLFVIGGDGSMRGAAKISDALLRRGETIGVIGIPKTIDNDIPFIGQSFGFVTSFTEAAKSINAAMVEAHSAVGGVGLVKLMGRHAGFIASYAALANHVADFVLIPEVPFRLEGPGGFLSCLEQRVKDRGSAVVVVAEGAGQEILDAVGATDASGNVRLADIGTYLRDATVRHFATAGVPLTLQVHRSELHDQVGAGLPARRRLLRPARPGRRPRGNGRSDGDGGGASAQPLHPRADRVAHLRAQPGGSARRPVAQRAGVDRSAGLHDVRARPASRALGSSASPIRRP